ncbi:MAG: PilZ domain-containing protein [Gammaproteobacteria bacterium]|nr:PilZ domain-containing protein [Gammaproteobacteria bacterium]
MEDNTTIRKHIRQITGIPIQVKVDFSSPNFDDVNEDTITNVSLGGLSFIADDRLDIEESIKVRFPILDKETVLTGKVIWCEKSQRGYEVGLEFDDEDEIQRLKMIDQISDIENYRTRKEAIEGIPVSSEQAAREWVKQYAGEFSAL